MIKFKKDWPLKSIPKENLYPKIKGKRIYLCPPQKEDYEQWVEVRRRNQDFLKPFEPKWPNDALSEEFFKRRLKKQSQEMEAGRGVFFLIRHNQNENIVGGINLNNIQYGAARSASLGYWLDKNEMKKGYMYEAANFVIRYAFSVLNLHRLNAACLPDNRDSINLLLKLNFEEEGFAKKYLQINGDFEDHRLFGLSNKAEDGC